MEKRNLICWLMLWFAFECTDATIDGPVGNVPAASCPSRFADCDGDSENGCEAALETSVEHCGACGSACAASPGATAVCLAGSCSFTCDEGKADCDGDSRNGCETDLGSDDHHCGACGVVCDESCTGGTCDLEILAEDQAGPVGIVLDETSIYWLNRGSGADGSIVRLSKEGGQVVSIAEAQVTPVAIALDGASVYWTTYDGSVLRAPKGGGEVTKLAGEQRLPSALVVEAGALYWTNAGTPPAYDDGAVMSLDLEDPLAEPVVLASIGGGLIALGASSGKLAVAAFGIGPSPAGTLWTLETTGAKKKRVAEMLDGPSSIAFDGTTLFAAVANNIVSLRPDGTAEALPLLEVGSPSPATILLDGASLLWTTNRPVDGQLKGSRRDGTREVAHARGLVGPFGVAADGKHLYFTQPFARDEARSGRVARVPRRP